MSKIRYNQISDLTGNGAKLVTSTGALTQNVPLLYDASGNAIVSTRRGNTTTFQCADSTSNPTPSNLAMFDANGNMTDSGINSTTGSGGSFASWHPYSVDVPPNTAGSLDDEFNSGTTINTGRWTQVNWSTTTNSISNSVLTIIPKIIAGVDNLVAAVQASPSTPWEVVTKVSLTQFGTSNTQFGLTIYDGTKFIVFTIGVNGSAYKIAVYRYSNFSTFSSSSYSTNINTVGSLLSHWYYLKVKDDGTNLIYKFSVDGINYFTILTEARAAFLTPSNVGVVAEMISNTEIGWGTWDYFRRTL